MQTIQSLFRPEAVEEAQTQFGFPVRPVGLASWVLTAFMTLLLVVAAIFLCTARYTRTETVTGILQPTTGALRVTTNSPATIAAVLVREGQFVPVGAPLIRLALDPTMEDGRRLGEVLSVASNEQAEALAEQALARNEIISRQREEVAARRTATLEQKRRLMVDIALQIERVHLARQSADAAKILFDKQLLPAIQYRQREEALIVARQGLSIIENELAAIPSTLAQLSAQNQRLLAEAREGAAGTAVSQAQLAERRASASAGSSMVLLAPRAGQVAALQAREGAPVAPGATLAIVLPRGVKLQADLWVPSRAAGFIRPGDRVRVMYDAFPYQRFGVGRGTVSDVARAPTNPSDLSVPLETKEALFRVAVNLDEQTVWGYGRSWPLAPGMRVSADLVLEEQSLFAWLFDKVRAMRNRSSTD